MNSITYLKGDATHPDNTCEGKKIICHICNDKGYWGKGFVLALSKRWKLPEEQYRRMSRVKRSLGNTEFVIVDNDIIVANMIAQHDIKKDKEGNPPIRYEALAFCLGTVGRFASSIGASLHMPRIGAGLAGGDWEKIEKIIEEVLEKHNIDAYVYDI